MKSLLFLLALFAFVGITGRAQGESPSGLTVGKSVSRQTYDQVLDEIFPRGVLEKKETDWQIVLRFIPDSTSESQIVIRKNHKRVYDNEIPVRQWNCIQQAQRLA